MLYIKFNINDQQKYQDFQKLYKHMVMTRQPGFEFKEEEPKEIDWDNLTEEESNKAIEELHAYIDKTDEQRRYEQLIPPYAHAFLEKYSQSDVEKAGAYSFDIEGIFNYLEFSFEVDMISLQKLENNLGLIEFEALGFPYGGMERFLMVLKAFELIPTECYNGFTVYKFNWTSVFTHKSINLPKKTKSYKKGKNIHKSNFWDKIYSIFKS
ncbi:MAG: hypothetical protein HWD85_00600 [Flavobacteriaceae bacterium]|nr:hypothetical protein [Flavobacteriaceae bacterium]